MTQDGGAPPRANAQPWFAIWHARHTRAAGLLLAAVLVLALVHPATLHPTLAAQITALVAAVAIFGVPHGALDPLVGRRWLAPRLGPHWWAPFHGAYVALAAVVVAGWILAPAATLTAFLAASIIHFGLGDVATSRAPRGLASVEILVRGAAPIVVPAAAHPDAVRQAFAWVAPGASAAALDAIVATSAHLAWWVVLPGCVAFALAHAGTAAGRRRDRAANVADAVECVAVPAIAMTVPPFVAFLLYFCLLHSARHALALAASLDPARPGRAWAHFARAALPATLATLALGTAVWLALAGGARPLASVATPAAVRVLFAGLAALTAPHMLLTALAGDEQD